MLYEKKERKRETYTFYKKEIHILLYTLYTKEQKYMRNIY